MFWTAQNNAKTAGKLLGIALALRRPFSTQTVSLIGFSLGSQVIKSCLEMLHYIYEPIFKMGGGLAKCDLIQDVTFMGGATCIEGDEV